jgi:hypothetical protein
MRSLASSPAPPHPLDGVVAGPVLGGELLQSGQGRVGGPQLSLLAIVALQPQPADQPGQGQPLADQVARITPKVMKMIRFRVAVSRSSMSAGVQGDT